ncbi:MAG: DUF6807 family protein [Pirellulales bacterium]
MSRSESQAPKSPRRFSRRGLLRGAAVGVAASTVGPLRIGAFGPSVALATDFEQSPAEAVGLTAYEREGQVFIRWNNSLVVSYRAHASLKYPYLSPLVGPASGIPLTTESSLPYPHHRGVWLGCEPLNGGDYWSDGPLDQGQILSAGPKLGTVSDTSVVIDDQCEWIRKEASSPLVDRRKFTVRIPSERIRAIDVEIDLTAREDIRIESAKHSLFALRVAADISPLEGGVLLNSNGDSGAEATFGRPAAWCGYHGSRRFSKVVEGIAVFNHPDNFDGDCPWFTRDYGHLSPSPFNFLKQPWTLENGNTLALKYCVVMHAGTPREANLDKLYQEWVNGNGRFIAVQSG